ncbi:MAG: hypoxanthine phosphoribosyltransferase [Cyclobacteriaceae bacterium]
MADYLKGIFTGEGLVMKIKDIEFRKFLSEEALRERVSELAESLDHDYESLNPIFVPILNGAFVFAADLTRSLKMKPRISFVKHSSYTGTSSNGQLKSLIGLQESVFKQDIVIVEDIVDSGLTIQKVVEEMSALGTRSVEVVTLLKKQNGAQNGFNPKYVGFEIPDHFVVGYGMDYDGTGRNLRDLWQQELSSVN